MGSGVERELVRLEVCKHNPINLGNNVSTLYIILYPFAFSLSPSILIQSLSINYEL